MTCRHCSFRFLPDGSPFPSGVEVCDRCGARRLVEGDHTGPWTEAAVRGSPPKNRGAVEPEWTPLARNSTRSDLGLIAEAFDLDDEALAVLLRSSPVDLSEWRSGGGPAECTAEVVALAGLATRLLATYSEESVRRVMSAPVPGGSGWSPLDAIAAGQLAAVVELLAPVGDYLMDADPQGVRQRRFDAIRSAIDAVMVAGEASGSSSGQ